MFANHQWVRPDRGMVFLRRSQSAAARNGRYMPIAGRRTTFDFGAKGLADHMTINTD